MTQIFDETGRSLPVTLIDLNGLKVVRKDEANKKVWIGIGEKKHSNKSEAGLYKELKSTPVKSFESDYDFFGSYGIGDDVSAEILNDVKKVDIASTSKGKGFAGVVKRWGFAGGPKTHGQSDRHRAPGSVGAGTTPGRVFKGKKMGGHMGNKRVTVQNLKVLMVDPENKVIAVKGAVPGATNALVEITFKK